MEGSGSGHGLRGAANPAAALACPAASTKRVRSVGSLASAGVDAAAGSLAPGPPVGVNRNGSSVRPPPVTSAGVTPVDSAVCTGSTSFALTR